MQSNSHRGLDPRGSENYSRKNSKKYYDHHHNGDNSDNGSRHRGRDEWDEFSRRNTSDREYGSSSSSFKFFDYDRKPSVSSLDRPRKLSATEMKCAEFREKFKSYVPYLKDLVKSIHDQKKNRTHEEDLEDIEYFMGLARTTEYDQQTLECFQGAHVKIFALMRKFPIRMNDKKTSSGSDTDCEDDSILETKAKSNIDCELNVDPVDTTIPTPTESILNDHLSDFGLESEKTNCEPGRDLDCSSDELDSEIVPNPFHSKPKSSSLSKDFENFTWEASPVKSKVKEEPKIKSSGEHSKSSSSNLGPVSTNGNSNSSSVPHGIVLGMGLGRGRGRGRGVRVSVSPSSDIDDNGILDHWISKDVKSPNRVKLNRNTNSQDAEFTRSRNPASNENQNSRDSFEGSNHHRPHYYSQTSHLGNGHERGRDRDYNQDCRRRAGSNSGNSNSSSNPSTFEYGHGLGPLNSRRSRSRSCSISPEPKERRHFQQFADSEMDHHRLDDRGQGHSHCHSKDNLEKEKCISFDYGHGEPKNGNGIRIEPHDKYGVPNPFAEVHRKPKEVEPGFSQPPSHISIQNPQNQSQLVQYPMHNYNHGFNPHTSNGLMTMNQNQGQNYVVQQQHMPQSQYIVQPGSQMQGIQMQMAGQQQLPLQNQQQGFMHQQPLPSYQVNPNPAVYYQNQSLRPTVQIASANSAAPVSMYPQQMTFTSQPQSQYQASSLPLNVSAFSHPNPVPINSFPPDDIGSGCIEPVLNLDDGYNQSHMSINNSGDPRTRPQSQRPTPPMNNPVVWKGIVQTCFNRRWPRSGTFRPNIPRTKSHQNRPRINDSNPNRIPLGSGDGQRFRVPNPNFQSRVARNNSTYHNQSQNQVDKNSVEVEAPTSDEFRNDDDSISNSNIEPTSPSEPEISTSFNSETLGNQNEKVLDSTSMQNNSKQLSSAAAIKAKTRISQAMNNGTMEPVSGSKKQLEYLGKDRVIKEKFQQGFFQLGIGRDKHFKLRTEFVEGSLTAPVNDSASSKNKKTVVGVEVKSKSADVKDIGENSMDPTFTSVEVSTKSNCKNKNAKKANKKTISDTGDKRKTLKSPKKRVVTAKVKLPFVSPNAKTKDKSSPHKRTTTNTGTKSKKTGATTIITPRKKRRVISSSDEESDIGDLEENDQVETRAEDSITAEIPETTINVLKNLLKELDQTPDQITNILNNPEELRRIHLLFVDCIEQTNFELSQQQENYPSAAVTDTDSEVSQIIDTGRRAISPNRVETYTDDVCPRRILRGSAKKNPPKQITAMNMNPIIILENLSKQFTAENASSSKKRKLASGTTTSKTLTNKEQPPKRGRKSVAVSAMISAATAKAKETESRESSMEFDSDSNSNSAPPVIPSSSSSDNSSVSNNRKSDRIRHPGLVPIIPVVTGAGSSSGGVEDEASVPYSDNFINLTPTVPEYDDQMSILVQPSIPVNTGLAKIKIESDYLAPSTTAVKTEPLDQDHNQVRDHGHACHEEECVEI